eukprot:Skav230315  [mRNA]  locus=scaffold430:223607:224035:- [translate_table: standard]
MLSMLGDRHPGRGRRGSFFNSQFEVLHNDGQQINTLHIRKSFANASPSAKTKWQVHLWVAFLHPLWGKTHDVRAPNLFTLRKRPLMHNNDAASCDFIFPSKRSVNLCLPGHGRNRGVKAQCFLPNHPRVRQQTLDGRERQAV